MVTIAGVAWAPPDGVDAVELAIDDGPWLPAEVATEASPLLWRHWRHDWLAEPGAHTVRVRARARGQRGEAAPPYPVGASGHHTIDVGVTAGVPTIVDRASAVTARARGDAGVRVRLAAAGVAAWRRRGYPPAPRWPAPTPRA